MVKVKATSLGEYPIGKWREPGAKFEFNPVKKPKGHKGDWHGDKPASWMEEVEEAAVEPTDPPSGE